MLDVSDAHRYTFDNAQKVVATIKEYARTNNSWGANRPYPGILKEHKDITGPADNLLDEVITFRLQYVILQLAYRFCGVSALMAKNLPTRMLNLEKTTPDSQRLSTTLVGFINSLREGQLTVAEA